MKLKRKQRVFLLKHNAYIALVLGVFCGALLGLLFWLREMSTGFISPCPKEGCEIKVQPSKTLKPIEKPIPLTRRETIRGIASYYSIEGCLGCNPGRIMANGQKLDDSRLTLAYNNAPLNSVVKVRNIQTGLAVDAVITDTGGFNSLGRIADLSIATKKAIGCGNLCDVEIELRGILTTIPNP